jgi:hypothetical protein
MFIFLKILISLFTKFLLHLKFVLFNLIFNLDLIITKNYLKSIQYLNNFNLILFNFIIFIQSFLFNKIGYSKISLFNYLKDYKRILGVQANYQIIYFIFNYYSKNN